MNHRPATHPRHLQLLALAAAMTLGSLGFLPAVTTTNAPAAVADTTNAPPATNVAAEKKPSVIIDTDNDDSDTDTVMDKADKDGHTETIRINTNHGRDGNTLENVLDDAIPLAGIIATFGMPVLIVYFICYFRHRRRQATLDLVREYLNKGLPVPPQLLDDAQGCGSGNATVTINGLRRNRSDLRRGFNLAFIGLGISVAMYIGIPHSNAWGWGMIPAVMGLGYIVSGLVEGRQPPADDKSKPTPPGTGNPL